MKRILVTGGKGMLGQSIVEALKGSPSTVVYTMGRSGQGEHHINVDLSDVKRLSILLDEIAPQYVIHCAASVNIEMCEKEKQYVYDLHVGASRVISNRKSIVKSVFISTDAVFDGQKGNYKEEDFVAPLNYYALTKALAEESFLNACHDTVVLRTNIIGFTQPFGNSLFEWAWHSLNESKQITGYKNVLFNPLYVDTVAQIVNSLLFGDYTGVLHIGCEKGLSKYDFLIKLAEKFGYPLINVREGMGISSGEVRRPLNTVLNIEKAGHIVGFPMPGIEIELDTIFKKLNQLK